MKSLKFLPGNKFQVKSIPNRDAIYTTVRKIQSWEAMHCVNDATHYLCYSLFRMLNKWLVFTYPASSCSCFPGLGQFSCVILFLSLSSTSLALQSSTTISRNLFPILLLHLCLVRCVSAQPSHPRAKALRLSIQQPQQNEPSPYPSGPISSAETCIFLPSPASCPQSPSLPSLCKSRYK